MRTGELGLALIKSFEGYQPKMYKCPAGLPTIGYGTLIDTAEEEYLKTKVLTEAEATALLAKELVRFEAAVNLMVKKPITQNQFDALVSFAFNCGTKNLQISTLLRLVNNNPNDPAIAEEFMKWTKANGKRLAGLVRRRAAEQTLYFKK